VTLFVRNLRLYFDCAIQKSDKLDSDGILGIGVICQNGRDVKRLAFNIGRGTVNHGEYVGLFLALSEILQVERGGTLFESVTVYGDSQVVIRQMTGEYEIKNPGLLCMAFECCALCDLIKSPIRFQWIPREQNTEADTLSKRGLLLPEIDFWVCAESDWAAVFESIQQSKDNYSSLRYIRGERSRQFHFTILGWPNLVKDDI